MGYTLPAWAKAGIILVILALIAGVTITVESRNASRAREQTDSESLIVRSATSTDHLIGDLSAPVQLIVYADLSCTYCKSFFGTTLPKLESTYGDRIVVAYRELPLESHPNSRLEAEAAECVSRVGGEEAFWNFVYAVFAVPGYDKGLELPKLSSVADAVGVSGEKMTACVQDGFTDQKIRTDALEASIAGIGETPSTVLKSATRAFVIQGDYYAQLNTGIAYLLQPSSTEK